MNLNISVAAICNQTCVHGVCANPYKCTCQAGWNGTYCTDGMYSFCKTMNGLYQNNHFFFSYLHTTVCER